MLKVGDTVTHNADGGQGRVLAVRRAKGRALVRWNADRPGVKADVREHIIWVLQKVQ